MTKDRSGCRSLDIHRPGKGFTIRYEMSFSGLPWGRKFYPHTHTHGDSHTHGRHGYFNVRSKDDISQLNLPHGSTTKKYKTEKVKKWICSEVTVNRLGNPESVLKKKGRLRWEGFAEK